MSCPVYSLKEFKLLRAKFGLSAADSIVRQYSRKQGSSEFVYPTVKDALKLVQTSKDGQVERVSELIKEDQHTTATIVRNLKGIVNRYNGGIFITSGNTSSGSSVINIEQRKLFFDENLKRMMKLQEIFPETFTINDTKYPLVKTVTINATDVSLFDELEQEMPPVQPQGLKKTNPYAVEPGAKPEAMDLGDTITLSVFDSFFPDYSELSTDEKENFLKGLNNEDIEYFCSI
jgi:hypothetical protein